MSRRRIAIMTSRHPRHGWFVGRLARNLDVVALILESKPEGNPASVESPDPRVREYFQQRDVSERNWFGDLSSDTAAPLQIVEGAWGHGNSEEALSCLMKLQPDAVVLFGCSIIRPPLLAHFEGRILNMHLGLSPYYRGSATNFWPLVDGKPECVGVTIHHATLAVDGGAILAQARPDVEPDDDSHDLGCKTIIAGADCLDRVLSQSGGALPEGTVQQPNGKLCRRSDFTPAALACMQENFAQDMIGQYLAHQDVRQAAYPIIEY